MALFCVGMTSAGLPVTLHAAEAASSPPRVSTRQQLSILVTAMAAQAPPAGAAPTGRWDATTKEATLPRDANVPPLLMPQVIVREMRVLPQEHEMLTRKGKLTTAQHRYLSPLYQATFGPLAQVASYYFNFPSILGGWHPNEAEAMTLYWEDDRRRILSDMDSLMKLETDPKRLKELQRLRQQTRTTGIDALYW